MTLSKSRRYVIVGLIVAGFLGVCLWQFFREDYGVGVASVRWLPSEARNITYIRNDLLAIAEFDIEQGVFEKWCAKRKMPLRKLGVDEGCDVRRCLALLQQRGIIAVVPEPNAADPQAWSLWSEKRGNKSLSEGDLYYEESWANGGGYTLGYDVKEKRGYYHYSHH
jgi:hypothetical protein